MVNINPELEYPASEPIVALEQLNESNERNVLAIETGEIPEKFVEPVEYTVKLFRYGCANGLRGNCYAIKSGEEYAGIILIGEAILGDLEPEEIRGKDPFRIIGFTIGSEYRGKGIGRRAFQLMLDGFYRTYGHKPIILECHKENKRALRFYERFGFVNTGILTGTDWFLIKD